MGQSRYILKLGNALVDSEEPVVFHLVCPIQLGQQMERGLG